MDLELSAATLPAFLAEDRGPSLLKVASFFIFLSTAFVCLRFYTRCRLTATQLNIQDAIIPFAWLAEIGLCINGILMVKYASTGRHIAYIVTVDPSRETLHFKGLLVTEFLHPAAVAFPRLVVVLLYLHVLTNHYERVLAKVLIILIGATWFAYTVAAAFQCFPFAFNYDKTIARGRCFNVEVFANSSSIPNIVTGLAVLLLPIRTVWHLKISATRRTGLLLVFFTGSAGMIASIVRTIVFARTLAVAGPLDDSPWNHVALIKWTIIEPGIYLLSACALSFRPLFSMAAKAMHLQALVTNKFPGGSSLKKRTATTQIELHARNARYVEVDSLRTLIEEVDDNRDKTGATITKTVEVDIEISHIPVTAQYVGAVIGPRESR